MGIILSLFMPAFLLVPVPILTGPLPKPLASQPIKRQPIKQYQSQDCPLLLLPAELRNRIYRFVLVVDGSVPATERDWEDAIEITQVLRIPALLSTCKQIRKEAAGIWLFENCLSICIDNCDSTLLSRFCALRLSLLPAHKGSNVNIYELSGGLDWPNLMRWCRKIHARELGHLNLMPSESPNAWDVVVTATIITVMSRGRYWTRCEAALASYRKVAGMTDARWLQD
ncbi:hypothetical protein Slin15195_G023630 [Septoria linicola]|uniref:F-box domain-containing protein n=1 Tax=Septoria linicola TaxID=215465 RepID=A0A9Q9AJI3_9PEZI|nr:hypothetical protein Slin14017_G022710 [Septoria linicola]USW49044.1 hypothetical protein Slin15195_G023630 [Septoria linicola]